MKVLHILKSEPSDIVEKITDALPMDDTLSVVVLYEDPVDWSSLVDQIFNHDKVICWW